VLFTSFLVCPAQVYSCERDTRTQKHRQRFREREREREREIYTHTDFHTHRDRWRARKWGNREGKDNRRRLEREETYHHHQESRVFQLLLVIAAVCWELHFHDFFFSPWHRATGKLIKCKASS
jgi:hypothetical protein